MSFTFEVGLPGPIDVPASIDRFRRWGDDGVDRWDGETLIRTAPSAEGHVPYLCRVAGPLAQPSLRVTVASEAFRQVAEQAAASMFVTMDANAWLGLCETDRVVGQLNRMFPGVRPIVEPDPLTALIRSISAQQVNLTWAATTRRRLVERFGERHELDGQIVWSFSAGRLAAASPEEVRELQFTNSKSRSIVAVARSLAEGELDVSELERASDDQVIQRLCQLPGIGRWSAEWYLARTLGRPVVVAGDLGVRKAIGAAYLGTTLPPENDVREATMHWGPAAGIAQQLLLHALTAGVDLGSLHARP